MAKMHKGQSQISKMSTNWLNVTQIKTYFDIFRLRGKKRTNWPHVKDKDILCPLKDKKDIKDILTGL